ncbi:uncharacterized protein G2W53_044655 [Senna tora]|uniref:Uncharacterized protein n=1 Tax=Senna tora TaxID=362788 RepID=A0A834SEV9_9FABA|nr:uncharacterized protein G2W53_044655 [Senna tora]
MRGTKPGLTSGFNGPHLSVQRRLHRHIWTAGQINMQWLPAPHTQVDSPRLGGTGIRGDVADRTMSQVHEQGASHHPFARDVAGGMEHDQFNTPLANPYVPSPPEPSRGPHFCEVDRQMLSKDYAHRGSYLVTPMAVEGVLGSHTIFLRQCPACSGLGVKETESMLPVLPTRAPNLPALHAGVEEEGTSRPTFPDCEPSGRNTRGLVPVPKQAQASMPAKVFRPGGGRNTFAGILAGILIVRIGRPEEWIE